MASSRGVRNTSSVAVGACPQAWQDLGTPKIQVSRPLLALFCRRKKCCLRLTAGEIEAWNSSRILKKPKPTTHNLSKARSKESRAAKGQKIQRQFQQQGCSQRTPTAYSSTACKGSEHAAGSLHYTSSHGCDLLMSRTRGKGASGNTAGAAAACLASTSTTTAKQQPPITSNLSSQPCSTHWTLQGRGHCLDALARQGIGLLPGRTGMTAHLWPMGIFKHKCHLSPFHPKVPKEGETI